MRALVVLRRTLPVLLLLPLVACYDDDDDGPTGPPGPAARIAGVWSGDLLDRFFCSERERIRGDLFLDLERRR